MRASTTVSSAVLVLLLLVGVASAGKTVSFVISSGSGRNWMAVQIVDAVVFASNVEVKQASAPAYTSMTFEGIGINNGWWTYKDWSKVAGFDLPLSFRITGANGAVFELTGIVPNFNYIQQPILSLDSDFFSSVSPNTPTITSTNPPPAPTAAATLRPVITTPPTTTAAPTTTTTTRAPTTAAPTTRAPVVTSPVSSCGAKPKLMVPLYVYPGATWDLLAVNARAVQTVAIINPNSGPGSGPNAAYVQYMNKLVMAGVELVGYVHTQWGARDINVVKNEINIYATMFPQVTGIFLDEGSADASQLPYYKSLHDYIMSMPGYTHNIVNPGTTPDPGYLNVATQIVTLENYGSTVAAEGTPSYASCANKEKFAAIVHTVGAGSMQSMVDSLLSKGYFGYYYVTDGAGGCCTYNALTSYYASLVAYLATK